MENKNTNGKYWQKTIKKHIKCIQSGCSYDDMKIIYNDLIYLSKLADEQLNDTEEMQNDFKPLNMGYSVMSWKKIGEFLIQFPDISCHIDVDKNNEVVIDLCLPIDQEIYGKRLFNYI